MKQYSNVVIGLELDEAADSQLIAKAQEVLEGFGGTLVLVHAVEHLANYGATFAVSAGVDVEKALIDDAKKAIDEAAEAFASINPQTVVTVGPSKIVILEEAARVNADLIIVGSHGKHGVRLLLGSTANAILHSSQCDVLAVRVRD